MRKRFVALLLAGALVFSLSACGDDGAPSSSAPADETSTTTTATVEVITRPDRRSTRNCVYRTPAAIVFSTLTAYKDAMRTYTDSDTLYHLFKNTNAHGIFSFSFDGTLFDTLLVDGYFLLPQLPTGSTLTKAEFIDDGSSVFRIALSDGGSVTLKYRHDRRMTEEESYPVHTPHVNTGGATVTHRHTGESDHIGFYSWWEHGGYCRADFTKTTPDTADTFIKALSLEKIPTNA